jgi:hypothetical protein
MNLFTDNQYFMLDLNIFLFHALGKSGFFM